MGRNIFLFKKNVHEIFMDFYTYILLDINYLRFISVSGWHYILKIKWNLKDIYIELDVLKDIRICINYTITIIGLSFMCERIIKYFILFVIKKNMFLVYIRATQQQH